MISLSNIILEIELDVGFDLKPGDFLFDDHLSVFIEIQQGQPDMIVYGVITPKVLKVHRNQTEEDFFEKDKLIRLNSGTYVRLINFINEDEAVGKKVGLFRKMTFDHYFFLKSKNF